MSNLTVAQMKIPSCTNRIIIEVTSYLFILLFVYAAVSKIIDFENFQAQVGQSPLLSAYTGIISYGVLIIEILIAILLSVPKLKLSGLYGSFTLMVLFTAYITIILNYSSNIPCSCGGILEAMGWKEHLVFNCFFVLLAAVAILLHPFQKAPGIMGRNVKKRIAALIAIALLSSVLLGVMYITSERIMHHENPFIRTFITGSAERSADKMLHNTSLYFAGTDGTTIYVGDSRAPLQIFAFDTLLKTQKHYTIKLEDDRFPFKRVQVQVADSLFYVFDGTVPIIFKGKVSDWKANITMRTNDIYFMNAKAMDNSEILLKQYQANRQETVLARLSIREEVHLNYSQNLLQKQKDGLFDVDGMMLYSPESRNITYLYYYRNQFIVADNKLNLIYRGHTIDTNKVANLKVSYDTDSGKKQLASPGNAINKIAAVRDNLLFVNSTVRGRYESEKMWETASIIDVYDLKANTYLSSFYIYNWKEAKLRDMMLLKSGLFVLVGHTIQRYELGKELEYQE